MKHIRHINGETLAKEFSKSRDIRIELVIIDTNPPLFLAKLRIDGIRGYDGLANDPLLAIDRAFFQLAGEEVEDNE